MATAVAEVLASLADPGSFVTWQQSSPVGAVDGPADYVARIRSTRAQTGLEESVLTGKARIDGHEVVIIASAFEFLAGSVGQVAADQIVTAFVEATDQALPVIALPCSGGTRIQEAASAFFRMIDIAAAAQGHRRSGQLSVGWLRGPTMGGVLASWGSLGHIVYGEPDALIGFLGPRIFDALHNEPFPTGIQTAENLAAVGVIDAVVPLGELRERLSRILAVTASADDGSTAYAVALPTPSAAGAAACLASTRRVDRPGLSQLLAACKQVTQLPGTTQGQRSNAIRVALARLDGLSCVIVGQDRQAQRDGAQLGPAALRQARRGFAFADELGLPIVTIVDTPGAQLSADAECGALAGEIARCLAQLGSVLVPSVGVVLGMGCGGGALALLATDTVIAAQHGWVSPLPLEGASVIAFRSPHHVEEVAADLGIDAHSLHHAGVVDVVVAEVPDAADESTAFIERVIQVVGGQLRDLVNEEPQTRLHRRSQAPLRRQP